MHTVQNESLAEKNRGKLRLIHIFPGLVPGPGFSNPELPLWVRLLMRYIMFPLLGPFFVVKPEECGERMLSLASPLYPPLTEGVSDNRGEVIIGTDGKPGSGAYALTWNGDSVGKKKQYDAINKEELKRKVWDHTNKAFEVTEAGKVFKE